MKICVMFFFFLWMHTNYVLAQDSTLFKRHRIGFGVNYPPTFLFTSTPEIDYPAIMISYDYYFTRHLGLNSYTSLNSRISKQAKLEYGNGNFFRLSTGIFFSIKPIKRLEIKPQLEIYYETSINSFDSPPYSYSKITHRIQTGPAIGIDFALSPSFNLRTETGISLGKFKTNYYTNNELQSFHEGVEGKLPKFLSIQLIYKL